MQIHRLRGYIQNIFLIEYPHGCLLLDGACKADYKVIKDYFEQTLKRPLTDLKVVMVTHMHPDHAGCAHYLRKQTGCRIVSGDFSQQWYSGVSGRLAHLVDIFLASWVAKRLGRKRQFIWYPSQLHADQMLKEGDCVPEFKEWRVISTPGHTSMDISLYHAKQKILYVADLVVKVKGQLSPPFPVSFPQAYKNSLRRLHAFTDYEILMAHVPQQQISHQEIDRLIDEAPSTAQNNRQVLLDLTRKLARFKTQATDNS
jgi:glyoxylase-like metal-dependent hydrolase (beta-lactamase superfamily II)